MGVYSEMAADLRDNVQDRSPAIQDAAELASRRADDRQQAEEEQAKALLSQMQQNADDSPSPSNLKADKKAEEDRKRQEHEQAEAKRKAEWEARQRAKEEAEQAAWENAVAMSDDEVMAASMKRVGDDSERLTRRNMKQCVTEYIQTLCLEDVAFARNVMHPRKNMVNCFRYIKRRALPKVAHDIPLLSLDKTKSIEDLIAFQAGRTVDLSLKLDGLTTELIYENGQLIRLSTRGDGSIGENITHIAKAISGIPERIPYEDRLVVVGESFIHNSDFESLKSITDSAGNPYKNSRNLAAGSIRAFDAAICAQRHVSFLPFSVLEGFEEYTDWANGKHARLLKLTEFGFGVIHAVQLQNGDKAQYEQLIAQMREAAEKSDLPIDGLVLTYDEVDYSRTCGRTGHHFKDGLAFKFEDELYQSVLRDIEWTPSRTGEIAPVAVLDSVVIDGCTVSRASLHNLSFIEGLELMPGCRVLVSKRNMIIPHIEENLERGHFDLDAVTPKHCPCCGAETRFHITDGGKKALFCDNPDCAMRKLRRFVHFASKKAMDIEGLSEATLERLIARGWLHSFTDVYRLDHYMQEIICMDGFGKKSWDNLWGAIQRSRNTTFERYLIAMDIPMIGNHASKVLAKQFGSSPSDFEEAVENDFDFSQLPDFGETLHQNIHQWFAQEENRILWEELQDIFQLYRQV